MAANKMNVVWQSASILKCRVLRCPHSTSRVESPSWGSQRTRDSWTGAELKGNWADVDESMTMSTRPAEVVSAVRQWMTINFHLIGFIWKFYSFSRSLYMVFHPHSIIRASDSVFTSPFASRFKKCPFSFIVFTDSSDHYTSGCGKENAKNIYFHN